MNAMFKLLSSLACLMAFCLLVLLVPAHAQPLVAHHPRNAIPNPNIPIVHPHRASATGASPVLPKPNVAQGNAASCASSSQPAPIAAIVAALKCDPDLIFEYVYNNIEFEALYGSNKGPLGTLLDRRGD